MRRIYSILLTGAILALPSLVSAQLSGPLVPCDGVAVKDIPACQVCHVVELGQSIINFFVALASVVAVVTFAYAGFLMLTAYGEMGKISKAREIFTNVLIGLVIVLTGWLIIDTVMKWTFGETEGEKGSELYEATKETFGPWNKIKCAIIAPYSASTQGTQQGTTPTGSGGAPAGCPTCTPIDTKIVACKTATSCTIEAEYAARLYKLAQTSGVPALIVTEGYPQTREHQNQCHYNGTCTDIVFTDKNFATERIQSFAAAARAAGLRAVYEPTQGGMCPADVECQPFSMTGSTGNHFSLYKI